MGKKRLRVAIAALGAVALGITFGGSALAATPTGAGSVTDHYKAYTQVQNGLRCNNNRAGQPAGGTISAMIRGHETRPVGGFFQMNTLTTYVYVYAYVGGQWQPAGGKVLTGRAGASHQHGDVQEAPWLWNGGRGQHPRIKVKVDHSGTYKIVFATTLSNQAGMDLIPLHYNWDDGQGQGPRGHMLTDSTQAGGSDTCRFVG